MGCGQWRGASGERRGLEDGRMWEMGGNMAVGGGDGRLEFRVEMLLRSCGTGQETVGERPGMKKVIVPFLAHPRSLLLPLPCL